jgi:hypothetical protein
MRVRAYVDVRVCAHVSLTASNKHITARHVYGHTWHAQGMFPSVTAELEAAGWQLDHVRLPRGRWTAEWTVRPRRAKKED